MPFGNIPSLVSDSPFRIILIPGTSFEDVFKTSKDKDWMVAWTDRVQPYLEENRGLSKDLLVAKLKKETTSALYDNFFSITQYQAYLDCEILAIPAKYDYKPFAYAFQKDSPYLGLFNFYLKEMREKGTMKQILTKYEVQGQVCPDLSGKPLDFGAVFTAFIIWVSGLVLALIFFCLEKMADLFEIQIPFLNFYGIGNQEHCIEKGDFLKIVAMQKAQLESLQSQLDKMKGNSWIVKENR